MALANNSRSQAGFTLVETLVALFLVSIGTLAVAPVFAYAIRVNSAGAEVGLLGAVAMEQMELLRGTAYSNLLPGGDLDSDVAGYSNTSNPDVELRWTITDNLTPSQSRTITLQAAATTQNLGPRKEVTLTTIRAR